MHLNPAFRSKNDRHSIDFVRQRAFGVLTVNGPEHPLVAHIPFRLNEKTASIELHLMRSNPIWHAAETELPALIAVTGPDGYISPDWYDVPDQVPTWNYVAVHLHGTLSRVPQIELKDVLDRLSDTFESRLAPKTPWRSAKMSDGVMDRMMRMIVPMRMTITNIESTWKLNQNKSDELRMRAASKVETGFGSELAALATLMQAPPKPAE